MILWIDAQRSPALAPWIRAHFPGIEASSVRFLGMRDAKDREIFYAAREANAVVMTKDGDFVQMLDQFGPPPSVIWITCGNTSNERMRQILAGSLTRAMEMLQSEHLVEISDSF